MKAAGCFVLDRAEDLNLWRSRLCRSRCLPWPATRLLVSLTPGLWQKKYKNTQIQTNIQIYKYMANKSVIILHYKQIHKNGDYFVAWKSTTKVQIEFWTCDTAAENGKFVVLKEVEQVVVPAGRSSNMLTWRLECVDWNTSRGFLWWWELEYLWGKNPSIGSINGSWNGSLNGSCPWFAKKVLKRSNGSEGWKWAFLYNWSSEWRLPPPCLFLKRKGIINEKV